MFILWVYMPCNIKSINQGFGGMNCLHLHHGAAGCSEGLVTTTNIARHIKTIDHLNYDCINHYLKINNIDELR
jgi:hypothetical protein